MKLQAICCRDEVTRGRCRILVTAKRIRMDSAHTIDIRPEDEHYRGYRRSRYELLLHGSTVYQRRLLSILLNGRSLLAGLGIHDGRSGFPASTSSDGNNLYTRSSSFPDMTLVKLIEQLQLQRRHHSLLSKSRQVQYLLHPLDTSYQYVTPSLDGNTTRPFVYAQISRL